MAKIIAISNHTRITCPGLVLLLELFQPFFSSGQMMANSYGDIWLEKNGWKLQAYQIKCMLKGENFIL